jgi:hypothetical protein
MWLIRVALSNWLKNKRSEIIYIYILYVIIESARVNLEMLIEKINDFWNFGGLSKSPVKTFLVL